MRSMLLVIALMIPFGGATRAQSSNPADERPDQSKKTEPAPEDLKPLQGIWKVNKITVNGKEVTDRGLSGGTFTFQNSELIQEGGEPRERFVLEPAPGAEPKAFKATRVEPKRPQSGWMIYALEGDKLKIAFNDALRGRPESFEPRPKLIVLELSRKTDTSK